MRRSRRYLENVPDEDEDPLYDELVVLEPLVPVLLEEGAECLAQDSPQAGVYEGGLEGGVKIITM